MMSHYFKSLFSLDRSADANYEEDHWVLSIHLAKAPLNQLQVSPLQPCKLLSPTFEGKAMGLLYVKT